MQAEAWRMLGACHAEQDQDKLAIECLERAISQDPYNLEALLALGVSYVNELDSTRALRNLRAWVAHNPTYHGLEVDANDGYGDGSLMDEVMQLMLKAQEHSLMDSRTTTDEGTQGDPDVQQVLGVLYNVTRHLDSAAEAFDQAAKAQPSDHAVWNKLGATLANSQRSEDALPAYHRALGLKPRYARGWLNLGIAHANLGRPKASVRAYLRALELSPQADHIWNYIRIALSGMDRYDLVQVAAKQSIQELRDAFPSIPNDDPTALLTEA
mmetsp:Transcript_30526/g.68452  ORF Transcript_30526/g.68452 Transcript_30526/m.68452 type:complete len:269 (+) Transcript_30526:273-1079(+)